jgi:cytochrome c oxidase cbb3-type subunit III
VWSNDASAAYTRRIVRWVVAALVISCALAQTPADPADRVWGKKLFESQCALCHGQDGSGGRGPNLRRPKLNHAADDNALRRVISEGIEPDMPGFWQLSDREVASVAAYVKALGSLPSETVSGDVTRGQRLYKAKGCGGCHMISGDGSGYGPELTEIGAKRSPAFLRESIITPEAAVPEGFLLVDLVTPSGETIRGIRLNEDTFSIQVKDSSNGFHSFRKTDLSELRKLRGKSPMPSYERALAPEELTDLVAYLAGLRGKS